MESLSLSCEFKELLQNLNILTISQHGTKRYKLLLRLDKLKILNLQTAIKKTIKQHSPILIITTQLINVISTNRINITYEFIKYKIIKITIKMEPLNFL